MRERNRPPLTNPLAREADFAREAVIDYWLLILDWLREITWIREPGPGAREAGRGDFH